MSSEVYISLFCLRTWSLKKIIEWFLLLWVDCHFYAINFLCQTRLLCFDLVLGYFKNFWMFFPFSANLRPHSPWRNNFFIFYFYFCLLHFGALLSDLFNVISIFFQVYLLLYFLLHFYNTLRIIAWIFLMNHWRWRSLAEYF